MKTKTAKQHLKAYRSFKWTCAIILSVLFGVGACFAYPFSIVSVLLFFLAALVIGIGLNLFAQKKWVLSTLVKDLDAPLYYEIIKTGRFYNHLAIEHLQAEFYMGNYSNVLAICNQKLADPKVTKKYGYFYIFYLACVYFRTDDRDRLQQACQQMEAFLANTKAKPSGAGADFVEVFQFYNAYLRSDWDACEKWLDSNPRKTEFACVNNDYLRARVALEKGEIDKAKELFKTVMQRAPKLHLSTHAAHALEAIEAGRPYGEGIDPVAPTENFMLPVAPKSKKAVSVWLWVIIMCTFLSIVYLKWEEKQWDREYEAYVEEIRLIVEEDYDNVTVVQTFDPTYDDVIVDNMFVCEVDSGMILGAVYVYTDEETLCYDTFVTIDKADLQSEEALCLVAEFESATCYINIVMGFYSQIEDVPEDTWGVYYATAHGKSVYIAVISMEEIPH